MVAEPQRNRVRGSARFGDEARLQRGAWRRHARGLARRRRRVRREHDVNVRVPGDRACSAGQRPAEKVDAFGHVGFLPA
jgi:hypothetical protein